MTWKRVLWERHGGGATARGGGTIAAWRAETIDQHLNLFWENVTTKSRWLNWSKVPISLFKFYFIYLFFDSNYF